MSRRELSRFTVFLALTCLWGCSPSPQTAETINSSSAQAPTAPTAATDPERTPATVAPASAPAASGGSSAQAQSPQQVLQAQIAEINQQLNSQPDYVLAPEDIELLNSQGTLQDADADTLKALVKL